MRHRRDTSPSSIDAPGLFTQIVGYRPWASAPEVHLEVSLGAQRVAEPALCGTAGVEEVAGSRR